VKRKWVLVLKRGGRIVGHIQLQTAASKKPEKKKFKRKKKIQRHKERLQRSGESKRGARGDTPASAHSYLAGRSGTRAKGAGKKRKSRKKRKRTGKEGSD